MRPSASVLMTSIDLPFMANCTSPGFCALPEGMFSAAQMTAMTFTRGLSCAIARMGVDLQNVDLAYHLLDLRRALEEVRSAEDAEAAARAFGQVMPPGL